MGKAQCGAELRRHVGLATQSLNSTGLLTFRNLPHHNLVVVPPWCVLVLSIRPISQHRTISRPAFALSKKGATLPLNGEKRQMART